MEYNSQFLSAACNTVAQGIVWFKLGSEEFVAFAVSNSIAIARVAEKEVIFTLKLTKDEQKVNSVCYSYGTANEVYLFAGGDKGYVHCWRLVANPELQWELFKVLASEGKSITSMSSLFVNDVLTLSFVDTNGATFIYQSMELIQTLRFPPAQMPNTVHNTSLTTSSVLIILGCVDAKLHLFTLCEKVVAPTGQLSGHEEWITCISSIRPPEANPSNICSHPLLIASGSQDNKIRVWKIRSVQAEESSVAPILANASEEEDDDEDQDDEAADESEQANDNAVVMPMEDDELLNRQQARLSFKTASSGEGTFVHFVFLDSLLVGHEDWVTAVHWMPTWPPCLYSASMDRNLVLWREDGISYSPSVRVGDLGGALGGSIGGNLLGFVSACPGPSLPLRFMAVGYGGACHLWQSSPTSGATTSAAAFVEEKWSTVRGPWSGHFASVEDAIWSPSGDYLLTVSLDQTCRLFAPVASTGGEEKLIRAFEMPAIVRKGLADLCGINVQADRPAKVQQAYIPELGLSNKGREYMTAQEEKEQESRGVQTLDWLAPPLESQLADFTLWLETAKLFGHNNSVLALTASPDRQFMASSSKARYGATCVLMLWRVKDRQAAEPTYEAAGLLSGHESTVVCLEFSPCSSFLATAGKDRRICIYHRATSSSSADKASVETYDHVVMVSNAHKRIIWGLSWCPSVGDGAERLVTASRDGTMKLWQLTPESTNFAMNCLHTITPANGVPLTAISVLPMMVFEEKEWIVSVGMESGALQLWRWPAQCPQDAALVGDVGEVHRHSKTVKKTIWRPNHCQWVTESQRLVAEVASVSEDHSVRIHRVQIKR